MTTTRAELDRFDRLPPYRPRSFVPEDLTIDTWEDAAPLFERLAEEIRRPGKDLREWLREVGEVQDVLHQEYVRRHVRAQCDTENVELRERFLTFISDVTPKWEERVHRLDLLYLEHPSRSSLPADYAVMDESRANQAEIFREENLPLEVASKKIVNEYDQVSGKQTVVLDGRERTLADAMKELEEVDRPRRQRAWEAIMRRRLEDKDAFEDQFDRLVALRKKVAENAGFASYRDYTFRALDRFDYGPAECFRFHETVEKVVLPLIREMHEYRRDRLGLEKLRPWDLDVDEEGKPPLVPFDRPGELIAGCRTVFERLDPELGERFGWLDEHGMLDLDNRKGKAPGGFQVQLAESRFPFIFMNAVGSENDVRTLLHEGGHAFHSFEARHHETPFTRSYPIEFAEVASMGMEMLSLPHLDVFYQGDDLRRARRAQYERALVVLPHVAMIDAFQHWMYENPDHTRDERKAQWLAVYRRFSAGLIDWSGYEEMLEHSWHRILHFYHVPFYFIEYGLAQLGALQVWRNSLKDPKDAVRRYRHGLALGYTKPLPALFEAAGAQFDFSPGVIGELCDLVRRELAALSA